MVISSTVEQPNEAEGTRAGEFYRPPVDILEHADELVVQADIPGAKSEDIDVNFEDGALTIHAKVKERARRRGRRYCANTGSGILRHVSS